MYFCGKCDTIYRRDSVYNFLVCDTYKILKEISEEIHVIDTKLRLGYDSDLFEDREDLFLLREYVETHMV